MTFTNMELAEKGRERVAMAAQATSPEDWTRLWKRPAHAFPFQWGDCWKHCVEYRVIDFEAEVGFFIDVMGFSVNALCEDYAMFTGPQKDFYFAISAVTEIAPSTPADSIRLGFMIKDIETVAAELQRRGIDFESPVRPYKDPDASLLTGRFRTPNGIAVDLWGTKSA